MKHSLLILALLVALAPAVFAHEVRPAYLEMRQTGPELYDVLWKVPGQGDLHLGLYVELPATCSNVTEPRGAMGNASFTERWTVKCPGGLSGGTIHIAGLNVTAVDALVRLERLDCPHGLARGLKDAGLPDAHIPTALLFFSIGVEAGHFLFIGFVLSVTAVIFRAASRLAPNNQRRFEILQLLPPYAIGSVAMFWVIQRIAAF